MEIAIYPTAQPDLKAIFPTEGMMDKEVRDESICKAYLEFRYSMAAIARRLGISVRASRLAWPHLHQWLGMIVKTDGAKNRRVGDSAYTKSARVAKQEALNQLGRGASFL